VHALHGQCTHVGHWSLASKDPGEADRKQLMRGWWCTGGGLWEVVVVVVLAVARAPCVVAGLPKAKTTRLFLPCLLFWW
jgi:hypothetical protein